MLRVEALCVQALKGSNEDDVDATLDRVMMLFRYLQEKDVFEKYYKQHLAKRLLSGRAVRAPHGFHKDISHILKETSANHGALNAWAADAAWSPRDMIK